MIFAAQRSEKVRWGLSEVDDFPTFKSNIKRERQQKRFQARKSFQSWFAELQNI